MALNFSLSGGSVGRSRDKKWSETKQNGSRGFVVAFRDVEGAPNSRGAVRLALTTGVPIIPVRIVGTARALSHRRIRFSKIRIVVGEPIQVAAARPTVAASRALTRELQQRVEGL